MRHNISCAKNRRHCSVVNVTVSSTVLLAQMGKRWRKYSGKNLSPLPRMKLAPYAYVPMGIQMGITVKLITFNYLLTRFEEIQCKSLEIIKERNTYIIIYTHSVQIVSSNLTFVLYSASQKKEAHKSSKIF